ncbi:PREDICTED: carbonic anhydrase 9-like isoform X2 [Dinoponera quadriceps]|uniref:Carbonic anhydrase 9-like isoform X2 n=1 Tax=Dinoponera quadriceps TaxID=609295 RepID=A0A6P3XFA2_DINQU|nr:PREDICTED: carbonic anhydrase 9-like isoform X2 [Dinoponera quadriceps]
MRDVSQVTVAWIIFFVIVPGITGFGYSKKEQHLWPKTHKLCAGKLQSPVSISTSKAIPLPLPALEMIGYHDFLPMPQTLVNDGRTVKLTINKNATRGKKLPYVFGAALKRDQRYEMEQLHFHWGAKNNRGAEHVLNGVRYPMEMHIVHRNLAYPNLSHALQHEDGVVVVAVLFQLQDEHNEHLRPLLERLPDVKWAYAELSVNVTISLTSLIPSNTDVFHTYKGSLTTPPCSEAATWIIFATPVPISFRQMNVFRVLSSGEEALEDNFRHLQGVGQRKIYTRRMHTWLFLKHGNSQMDFSNFSWFWT